MPKRVEDLRNVPIEEVFPEIVSGEISPEALEQAAEILQRLATVVEDKRDEPDDIDSEIERPEAEDDKIEKRTE